MQLLGPVPLLSVPLIQKEHIHGEGPKKAETIQAGPCIRTPQTAPGQVQVLRLADITRSGIEFALQTAAVRVGGRHACAIGPTKLNQERSSFIGVHIGKQHAREC